MDFSSDPWPNISAGAKDLVRKMLDSDPKHILTAFQVLAADHLKKHPLKMMSTLTIALNHSKEEEEE